MLFQPLFKNGRKRENSGYGNGEEEYKKSDLENKLSLLDLSPVETMMVSPYCLKSTEEI